jgi:tetratricopeptide (TPR) repeat protein
MVEKKKIDTPEEGKETESPTTLKWEAAILNLSGLGLGYMHLKQWRRWGIRFGVTIAILTIATVLKGSQMPWLWIPLWFIWIGWMTLDGWLQGKRVIHTKNRIIISSIISLGVIAFGILIWVISYAVGTSIYKNGLKSFEKNDYQSALTKLNLFSNIFQLTFSPSIINAEVMRDQSALLIFGKESLTNFNYEDSVEAYSAFIGLYPDSEKIPGVSSQLAAAYHQWAFSLFQKKAYAEADAKYAILFDQYYYSTEITAAEEESGDMYMEWALSLRQAGDFETAIEKYEPLEKNDKVSGSALADEMSETYVEWGDQLNKKGDYETAQEKYEVTINDYGGSAAAKNAYNKSAANLLMWGKSSFGHGDFESSVNNLQKILDQYPDSSSVADAKGLLPDAMLEWVKQLYAGLDYERTAEITQKMIDDFPETEQTKQARVTFSTALIGWGQQLSKESRFILALEKFDLAEQETQDKDLTTTAKDEYKTALIGLANDTGADGQTVIQQAAKDACTKIKTTALGINLLKDQPGKAISCDETVTLPSDMLPTIPGTFRYVIQRRDYQSTIQSCPYSGGHTLVREVNKVDITLISTVTGQVVKLQTFTGSNPGGCPSQRYFYASIDYETGGVVAEQDILDWLIDAVIH